MEPRSTSGLASSIYLLTMAVGLTMPLLFWSQLGVVYIMLFAGAVLVPLAFTGPITVRIAVVYLVVVLCALLIGFVIDEEKLSAEQFKVLVCGIAAVDMVLAAFSARALYRSRKVSNL